MPPKLSSKRRIEKEIWKLGKDEQSRRQVTVVMSQLDKFAEQSKTVIGTKGVTVDFIKPGRTALNFDIRISAEEVKLIEETLQAEERAMHTFESYFEDIHGERVAFVRNTVYLRRRARGQKS